MKRLATETGAGQWGSALSCACQLMGLECMVYMVRISYDQKPYRRIMMNTYGGQVVPSPSPLTNAGRAHPRRASRLDRQPRHRHLRSGRRCGRARRHQIRARQRPQSRAAAPDGDRPGSDEADGAGRRLPGSRHRVPRRRQQFRRPRVSVSQGQAARARGRPCGRSRSSRPRAPASRRARATTTSATRPGRPR